MADEYISREAVINITAETGAWETQNRVRELPAADLQPVRRGEWEDERYDDLLGCYIATCSECGYESTDHYRITDNHRHCEYCGARMNSDTE